MRPIASFDKRNIAYWVAIFLTVSFLQLHRGTSLIVDMSCTRGGVAHLFYDRGTGYNEDDSVVRLVRPGSNHLIFPLPAGTYYALRFDPLNSDSEVAINGMVVDSRAPGSGSIKPDALAPLANIGRFERRTHSVKESAIPGSDDPQLQVHFDDPLQIPSGMGVPESAGVAAVFATALVLLLALFERAKSVRLVVSGMGVVQGLILVMALLSTTHVSIHPDEEHHFSAMSYFDHHWLPPAVDDLEVRPSISDYGLSYLFDLDVVYPLAAKVTAPLSDMLSSAPISARLFNVGLWLALLLMVARDRSLTPAFAVLLFSPQIWYVFSYFNGDALPLFLGMSCVALLIKRNGLSSFITGEGKFGLDAILFAVCIALLLLSKRNYLALVPGLILWIAIRHLGLRWSELICALLALLLLILAEFASGIPSFSDYQGNTIFAATGIVALAFSLWSVFRRASVDQVVRIRLMKVFALVAVAVIVAAPRVVWDVNINGFPGEKNKRIEAVAETLAGGRYKPSAFQHHESYPNLALASKGVGFSQLMFAPYHWIAFSAASAFGVYGYMNVFSPTTIYAFLHVLSVLAAGIVVLAIVRNTTEWEGKAACLCLALCVMIVLSSILHSWAHDFQPQGRYLFPCLPMLALLTHTARPNLPIPVMRRLAVAAFVASVCSFILFGLAAFVAPV